MKLAENRLIAWGTVALPLITLGSGLGAGIVYAVHLNDAVRASSAADADHEGRLRTIETNAGETRADVREIRTNVSWIRRYLDRQPPAPAAGKDTQQTASND